MKHNNTNKHDNFGKTTRKYFLILIASLLVGIPVTATAANKMFFLDTSGIVGETENIPYKNTINVQAWSWGMANSASFQDGSGGQIAKAHIQDLSFVHRVDTTSPKFMQHSLTSQHLPEMVLIIQTPGGGKRGDNPFELMKVEMTDVIVTSVAISASDGEDSHFENVTLTFRKVCVFVNAINPDGTQGKDSKVCWDIAKNDIP